MKLHGCHNKERKPGYYSPQRAFQPDGSFVVVAVYVPDRTSRDCQYRKNNPADPGCTGCHK